MKRILIDMDHVLADITTHYINWYYERTGIKMHKEDLLGKNEVEAFPDSKIVRGFLYTPGFFRTAPVMENAPQVVEQLNKQFEVFIVSAAMEFPQSLSEKFEWLQEHFPFLTWHQFVFCGNKKVTCGDFMIDDHLKNLDFFNGEKILFTSPHNQFITGYKRVNNWQEVAQLFSIDVF